jgi:uncharacterized membrane protein
MNSLGRWKIVAALVAIFLAGAIAGGVIAVKVAQRQVRGRADPSRWVDGTLARWSARLNLTEQQRERLRPVLEETVRDLRELRRRDLEQTNALMRRAQERLEPELNPAQREILHRMQEQRRRRLRRWSSPPEQH